jgi:hypothetical protein
VIDTLLIEANGADAPVINNGTALVNPGEF